MRLRLSILRHSLPPTNVLWSVPDTSSPQAYTIARLLEDVNHIVPLEAEHWGLEDYVVEVGGFECLHFSPVSRALKEDDQVSIRPLLTAEVRARTLTGRYQISEGGQHLVDGIPFGRPYLRTPSRPAVTIPPRKGQRLLEDTVVGVADTDVARLITANGETPCERDGPSIVPTGVLNHAQEEAPRPGKHGKTVQFRQPETDESDSSEEDDEDFAPDAESDVSDVSMDEDSDDDSNDSSDTSDTSSSSESDSDSDSASSSDGDASPVPQTIKTGTVGSTTYTPLSTPPGQGAKETQRRNQRRKESKRLGELKKLGILRKEATIDDMRQWNKAPEGVRNQLVEEAKHRPATTNGTAPRKRKHGAAETRNETPINGDAELDQRKQELIARFQEDAPSTAAVAEPAPKRLRPNTSAISRILAHQIRPFDKKSPKRKLPSTKVDQEAEEAQANTDPDFFKSKINVSAFECWDEEFTLSAPPFPFKQHWDPACKRMRDKTNKKKQRKAAKYNSPRDSIAVGEHAESMVLDYGNAPATDKAEADNSAAIESQLLQDVAVAAKCDLPLLPEDVSSLPPLTSGDVKVGAIIAFKLWTIDPVTVTPQISGFKTAVVEEEGDSGNGAGVIGLRLAERDREKRGPTFDQRGERVYDAASNFQMESDDEEDDGWREKEFIELVDARLLQAAAS